MGVHITSVSLYAHRVAFCLRDNFHLHRRSAEWLCFRLIGVIEQQSKVCRNPNVTAAHLYDQWKETLNREYDTL